MKMRLMTALGALAVCLTTVHAQNDTTYWKKGGFTSVTFSQVTLENWAAGGSGSISVNAVSGWFADYAKGRSTWENTLDMGYGLIKQEQVDFLKSDDKLNLVTKFGYQVTESNKNWFFSGLLDFRTQFAPGFTLERPDSAISRFMAPGYLVMGLGADYKRGDVFSANYIPLTGKFTFVLDDALSNYGAFGVDPGSKARAELGSYLRLRFKKDIMKNVNLESRLELFANYLEDFGNIDVNWQNGVVMKINKVLTANWFTHFIYDDDIDIQVDSNGDGTVDAVGPRLQFKSVFGVGLSYRFGAERKK